MKIDLAPVSANPRTKTLLSLEGLISSTLISVLAELDVGLFARADASLIAYNFNFFSVAILVDFVGGFIRVTGGRTIAVTTVAVVVTLIG